MKKSAHVLTFDKFDSKLNFNLENSVSSSRFCSFALFLRLHIAICLTWICKGLALLADDKLVIYSNVMFVTYGLVIFVLFVMNGHVLHLIHQRYVHKITTYLLVSPILKSNQILFQTYFQVAIVYRQIKSNRFE